MVQLLDFIINLLFPNKDRDSHSKNLSTSGGIHQVEAHRVGEPYHLPDSVIVALLQRLGLCPGVHVH